MANKHSEGTIPDDRIRPVAFPGNLDAIPNPPRQDRFRAIIDDRTVEFDNVEQKFEALAQIWKRHIRGKSIVNYSHFAYFQILSMGRSVVPFLLREIANGTGTWYVALQYIVNETAESPEMRGNPTAVRQAWLEWGMRNGYSQELEKAQRSD
jgi:hypothetical protein